MRASKHRPTQIRVDLEAIAENFQEVMTSLPAMTKGFAVVKANAYGHGAVAVANRLLTCADGFCVSNIDEALELRQAGIALPILVLGVVPIEAIPLAVAEKIAITVTSEEWLSNLLATPMAVADLIVHIKVDSGMGRVGFRDVASIDRAMAQLSQKGAVVEGIFTHFATADSKDTHQFEEQLQCFKEVISLIKLCPALVHASNSATSIWHPDTVFTMVRLGNVLYGLNPSGRELILPYPVHPALSLISELVQVKSLPQGAAIGYGATYHCQEREWVGTVPIGYADGLPRRMQGFSVLVDGEACEIIGRVSMDQITIRLSKAYPLGTKVTLIGQDKERQISVEDWADYQGTINYEVTCLLSDRIPRYYGD